ncbi:MAG TPA: hydrogenase expression/formation protein HypE, partial [Ignisphaera sp.]|nr:hydrogenase expression/formation protein HypE [Ignisphaera sp.]
MKRLIEIVHGAGAQETWEILTKIVFSKVPQDLKKTKGGYGIDIFDDGAVIALHEGFMVVSIDSYTVNPIFFPGGNIGTLAASGTINDLVVMGARPIAVLDAIVVEEGFDIDIL